MDCRLVFILGAFLPCAFPDTLEVILQGVKEDLEELSEKTMESFDMISERIADMEKSNFAVLKEVHYIHDHLQPFATKNADDVDKSTFRNVSRKPNKLTGILNSGSRSPKVKPLDQTPSSEEKRGKHSSVQHGQNCSKDVDCSRKDSRCFHGVCLCKIGLYFSPTQNACLKTCPAYGSKMDIYAGAYIKRHNKKIFRAVSLHRCQEECLKETSFLCKTADYCSERHSCYLSDVGFLDVHATRRFLDTTTKYIFAQRQCQ